MGKGTCIPENGPSKTGNTSGNNRGNCYPSVKTIKEQRDFIENTLGKEAKGAKKTMQMLMTIDGKHYDKIVYRLEDGTTKEFIFHLAQFPIGT
jgi:hypothetical protein